MPPQRKQASESQPSQTYLELSVRLVRSDGSVPFESKVNLPLIEGSEWQPAAESWFKMMESAVEMQQRMPRLPERKESG